MKAVFKFSILWTIAALLLVLACKRKDVEFIGPAYISAPEGFAVTSFTATPPSVNFTSGTVAFNATFTHTVSWTLTITGQQSGAVYQIDGISNGLTNVVWTGVHNGAAFFRTGETATATLSFFGTSLTSSTTVNITQAPDYTTCGQFPTGGDFEAPSQIIPFNAWYPFGGANVEMGVDSVAVDYGGNPVPSVQGEKYYFIRGLGTQQVFVSGIQYGGALLPALPDDADNVWINMYIYGTGDPNTAIELEYQEEDFDGTALGYSGTDDDAFVAKITADHKGWKLFSFQYSKLVPSLNANFGGSGNKIHEPDRLRSFDLILLKKSNPDSPVEVYFDYPIITVGGPFVPCN